MLNCAGKPIICLAIQNLAFLLKMKNELEEKGTKPTWALLIGLKTRTLQ